MKKISPKAIKLWRIRSLILFTIILLVGVTLLGVSFYFDWFPRWISYIVFGISIVVLITDVIIFPALKYKYFRYGIVEDELRIHSGIFNKTKRHIPLFRVQNIDTEVGPIMKKFGVKSVTFRTAEGLVEVPELEQEEADKLIAIVRKLINENIGRSI